MVRVGCCRKHRNNGTDKRLKSQSSRAGDAGYEMGPVVDRDPFCSSGGASDGGVSLASLAEMGGLSPVQEENTEVVTKNPMRAAIANGAQFHSVGGDSGKFHSGGGSSKFQSVGGESSKYQSSIGGDSSRREEGEDEDEEVGGMFADADVVAKLAAAAAQQVEKKDQVTIRKSGSGSSRWGWHQGAGGTWVKSSSWIREKPVGSARVERSPSARVSTASTAEEKAADAAPDAEPVRRSRGLDWMVSTSTSFNSRTDSEVAGWPGVLTTAKSNANTVSAGQVPAALGIVPTETSMEEKTKEAEEVCSAATVAESGRGAASTSAPPAAQAPTPSPQLVDGISPQAFGQAEMVAEKLPAVVNGRNVAPEPECEVPKPAVSGVEGRLKKLGDYSWLSSSGRGLKETANNDDYGAVGRLPQQAPLAAEAVNEVVVQQVDVPPLADLAEKDPHPGIKASATSPKAASVLPIGPSADVATAANSNGDADGVGQSSTAGPEQHETFVLHVPPKVQGTAPRYPLLTPLGSASRGFNSTAPDRLRAAAQSPSSDSPSKLSRLGPLVTPDRVRVSQVVEAFEKLTPRVKSGALTPGGVTPRASMWTTPVATPDRTPKVVKGPPEELSRGTTPSGGGGRVWSTPVATPDRAPMASAPDSGRGGATPERTATPDGACRAGKIGVSPTDEGQFAWQLESPAGVDGLPSPSDSDVRTITVKQKGGRTIPAILGAVDTGTAEDTPVLTPSTTDIKTPYHRLNSSGDSSSGAGWEAEARSSTEPSFGASQMAAFVADARAEAAAEAQAVTAEAEVEAAEKEAKAAEEEAKAAEAEARAAERGAQAQAAVTAEIQAKAATEAAVACAAAAAAAAAAKGYIDADADTDADEGPFENDMAEAVRGGMPTSLGNFEGALQEQKTEMGTNGGVAKEAVPVVGVDGGSGPVAADANALDEGDRPKTELENRQEEREQVGVEAVVEEPEEDEENPFDEAADVAALVAEAMALADKDGNHVDALYQVAGDEDGSDLAEQIDGFSEDESASSPTDGGGELFQIGNLASSKSILTWTEGEGTEDGDAERDAQEVKALVAEALALVKEASEDAKVDVVDY